MPGRSTQALAPGAGALPFVNLSMAVAEQLVRRARVLGGRPTEIRTFAVGGAQIRPAVVSWSGPDTAVSS